MTFNFSNYILIYINIFERKIKIPLPFNCFQIVVLQNMDTFDGAKTLSYVIIYLSMAFNIFIFCYIGEILAEQVTADLVRNTRVIS